MKTLIKAALAVSLVVTLTALAGGPDRPSQQALVSRHQVFKPFDRVAVFGTVHVLIDRVKGLKKSVATIQTEKSMPVTLTVTDHTLTIADQDGLKGSIPLVRLRMANQLISIAADQQASLLVNNISSPNLQVVASGKAQVDLQGLVKVSEIQQKDQSQVSVKWVDANQLHAALSDQAKLTLAGVAKHFIGQAKGASQINAEYLRANQAWVKANDVASVSITPIQLLSAFARQSANVYYYKYPKTLTLNSEQSANILQMAWRA